MGGGGGKNLGHEPFNFGITEIKGKTKTGKNLMKKIKTGHESFTCKKVTQMQCRRNSNDWIKASLNLMF